MKVVRVAVAHQFTIALSAKKADRLTPQTDANAQSTTSSKQANAYANNQTSK